MIKSTFGSCLILPVFLMIFDQLPLSLSAMATEGNLLDTKSTWTPEVLFENDRLFIINKPSGIGYHNDSNSSSKSMDKSEDGVLTLIRKAQAEGRIQYDGRLYGVHRLDKVTSGILVFTKDSESAGLVSKAFREKNTVKYYFALSARRPKKRKQGFIKGDMVKARRGAWQLKKTMENPALTRFYTCGIGGMNDVFQLNQSEDKRAVARTAILFQPITGRTHQLRVASKSEGMPILGDMLYSGTATEGTYERAYLHSTALHLDIDGDIGEVIVISPPPFGSLWRTQSSDGYDADMAFYNLFVSMMKKHCKSPKILSNMNVEYML